MELNRYIEHTLLKQDATKAEDIANACSFLASDRASYISGHILGVDGCASI